MEIEIDPSTGLPYIQQTLFQGYGYLEVCRMMRSNKGRYGDGLQLFIPTPQRMKVAARGKGLRWRLFNQLGKIFQIFVHAFNLQVGGTDKFGLGDILMSDAERLNFIDKIVCSSQEGPRLQENILDTSFDPLFLLAYFIAAYNMLTMLKVSPKSAHPGLAIEFLHAVSSVCCGLCLDVIGKQLRSG